jgi:hypothetical protein
MAVVVLIGLYFVWSFAKEVVQAQHLADQVARGQAENTQLEADKRRLAQEKAYYQSDDYIRLRARTDLNLRSPDEIVVLPLLTPGPADGANGGAGGAPPNPSVAAPPPAAPDAGATGRTWERWFALFRDPPR